MPTRPLRACLTPGCSARVAGGHCDAHRRVLREDHQRFGRLYSSQRWRRVRRAFLARHALCVACRQAGRVVPAVDVDHIVAHRGDVALFWRTDNLQSLCRSCHARKTLREVQGGHDRGAGSTAQRAPVDLSRVHNSGRAIG